MKTMVIIKESKKVFFTFKSIYLTLKFLEQLVENTFDAFSTKITKCNGVAINDAKSKGKEVIYFFLYYCLRYI